MEVLSCWSHCGAAVLLMINWSKLESNAKPGLVNLASQNLSISKKEMKKLKSGSGNKIPSPFAFQHCLRDASIRPRWIPRLSNLSSPNSISMSCSSLANNHIDQAITFSLAIYKPVIKLIHIREPNRLRYRMLLKSTLFVIPCLAASISGVSIGSYAKPVPSVPRLEHLFTGIFQIANPLKPIPIDGGVRVGKALNPFFIGSTAFEVLRFGKGCYSPQYLTTKC